MWKYFLLLAFTEKISVFNKTLWKMHIWFQIGWVNRALGLKCIYFRGKKSWEYCVIASNNILTLFRLLEVLKVLLWQAFQTQTQISVINDRQPGIGTLSQSHNFVACMLDSQPRNIIWGVNLNLLGGRSCRSAHWTISEEITMMSFGLWDSLLTGAEVRSSFSFSS